MYEDNSGKYNNNKNNITITKIQEKREKKNNQQPKLIYIHTYNGKT